MEALAITKVTLDDADAHALILRLNTELRAMYPEEGANHFRLDPDEVAPGRGAFLIARDGAAARGCGAVRLLEPGLAELKRMYVVPEARGRGIAAAVITALEDEARSLGARRVVLETGTRQLAAQRLYGRAGYVGIERYGEYATSPLSLCMAKSL